MNDVEQFWLDNLSFIKELNSDMSTYHGGAPSAVKSKKPKVVTVEGSEPLLKEILNAITDLKFILDCGAEDLESAIELFATNKSHQLEP